MWCGFPSRSSDIQAKLEKVENDTADAEYQYLEETDHGNIVKGFEGYVTSIEIQLLAPLDSYTSGLVRRTGKLGYVRKIGYSAEVP